MTLEKRELENEEDRKPKKTEKTPSHARWVARVFLIAMSLSAAMSLCSGAVLEDAGYVSATLILLLFILLGIMFDIIGVAVTAAIQSRSTRWPRTASRVRRRHFI